MTSSKTTGRDHYHHGDLRNALARAAADLAAVGGPDAVTIRGAAREVGVTPTAAYRHFANQADLAEAARDLAMDGMLVEIGRFLEKVPTDGDPIDRALGRLHSAGEGYIRFALAEPGIFRTCLTGRLDHAEPSTGAQKMDAAPYLLLGDVLDELTTLGYLSPDDRPGAEAGPWSAVHGLALLLIDGPLRGMGDDERDLAIERTLTLVEQGLATGPRARLRNH